MLALTKQIAYTLSLMNLLRGKFRRTIFYKFMNDVVQIMHDPFHPHDRDVIDFFNTITYLSGKATTCFIRSPKNLVDRRDSHRMKEKKMNLGGPKESVCREQGQLYNRSGCYKSFVSFFIKLVKGKPIRRQNSGGQFFTSS